MTATAMPHGAGRHAYRLIGGAGDRAVANGLSNAAWYKSPVPRSLLKALMRRGDARAAWDTLLWYLLIAGAGAIVFASLHTAWLVPALLLYSTLYAGPADSRWHEAGHATAFRTPWLNDLLYQIASFQVMRRPTVWRWSHARHHTDTLITGRDPEIQVRLPIRPLVVIADFFGLTLAPSEFAKMLVNASGRMIAEEATFIPASEWPRVIREARLWLAAHVAVVAAAVATGSWLPLLMIGPLPSICGAWLYNFFGITQHACLPENVLDHRLNSRTVLMNPVSRFLYWNMNYHVEHHMYPLVPYHALPALHDAVKADCPPPSPSLWASYREVISALRRQWRDPGYAVVRPLPARDSDLKTRIDHAALG
jgi:fatty acid desaturase